MATTTNTYRARLVTLSADGSRVLKTRRGARLYAIAYEGPSGVLFVSAVPEHRSESQWSLLSTLARMAQRLQFDDMAGFVCSGVLVPMAG